MTLWYILFRIPWHILLIAATLVVVGALALYSASEGSWQPWAGQTRPAGVCWRGRSLTDGVY